MMAEKTDGLDLRIHLIGESDSALDTRTISHVPKLTQRLPYSKPPPDTNWPKVSPRGRENPLVVSVTDEKQPARVRPYVTPRSHAAVYLTDSVKNWDPYPVNKSNSAFSTYVPPNTHRKPGSIDPRFRKVVPRKLNKSDIATDTEDLACEKQQSTHQQETGDNTSAKEAERKIEKDKAEKPESVALPLKRALSVDCGVQTPDLTCKPKQKTKENKVREMMRRTASDVSLGQSSCDTKRSYSEVSFNCKTGEDHSWSEKLHKNKLSGQARTGKWIQECKRKLSLSYAQDQKKETKAPEQNSREHDVSEHVTSGKCYPKSEHTKQFTAETEDAEWQTLEIDNYPLIENKSSLSVRLPKTVTTEKRIKDSRGTKSTRSKRSLRKRPTRESSTSLSRKGSNRKVKCRATNSESNVARSESTLKLVLMVLGALFVLTSAFWVLAILIGFIPAVYEWLYPPPEERYFSIFNIFRSSKR